MNDTKIISFKNNKTGATLTDIVVPEDTLKSVITAASSMLYDSLVSYTEEQGDNYGFPWENEALSAFALVGVQAKPVSYSDIVYFEL